MNKNTLLNTLWIVKPLQAWVVEQSSTVTFYHDPGQPPFARRDPQNQPIGNQPPSLFLTDRTRASASPRLSSPKLPPSRRSFLRFGGATGADDSIAPSSRAAGQRVHPWCIELICVSQKLQGVPSIVTPQKMCLFSSCV